MKYYVVKNNDKFLKHTIKALGRDVKVLTLFESPEQAASYATYGSSIVEYELNETNEYRDGQLPKEETFDV